MTNSWTNEYICLNIFEYPNIRPTLILFCKIIITPSLPTRKSKGREILRECSPPPQVSCVTRHMSHVQCQHIFLNNFILNKGLELAGEM